MNKILKRVISSFAVITTLAYTMPVFALASSETVYTKLNASGENYKTIVTTKDGENVEEKEIEKDLPIETRITYTIDGEEITAEELAGRSGRVTIKIEYLNKDEHKVNINGKSQTMYTPFVVMTGAIIDSNNNKNISVKNGKVVENGNKAIIVGVSLPGMKESLKLSGELDDINLPSSIEISMDSTNFSMKNILTYATPKMLEEDINWNKLDKLFNQANELQDAADKLEEGTNQLRDGASELNDGANALNAGASKLADGTDELYRTISAKIGDLKELEAKYSNKEKMANRITEIINSELKKMMPELQAIAEKEAEETVKRHKGELENSVVEKSLDYTQKTINAKMNEIEKNCGILTEEQEKALFASLEKDIEEVLKDVENNEQAMALKQALTNAIVKEVKTAVGKKTEEVVKSQISAMKKQGLSNEEKAALNTKAAPIITELTKAKIATKMQEQGLTAPTAELQAICQAEATKEVMALVGGVTDITLNKVEKNASTIAESTVDSVVTDLNKMTNTDGAFEQAIENYKKAIAQDVASALQVNDEKVLKQMEENIKETIVKDIEQKLENNQVLKGLEKQIKTELSIAVDTVATSTAKDLAKTYTETLATEMTNNIIKKQLSKEISSEVIDKELEKYETIINEKIQTLNSAADTLQGALYQINNGAKQLRDGSGELANGTSKLLEGTNTLADGMHEFNSKGINKINNLVNVDLYNLKIRGQKLEELSKEYVSFEGEEERDNIKFISIIDSIKRNEKSENKEKAILTEANTSVKSDE